MHGSLWNCSGTDSKGQHIKDFLLHSNLCLLNNSHDRTSLHSFTGLFSSIELTIYYSSLFLNYSWSLESDQLGSDHFSIMTLSANADALDLVLRQQLQAAD